jgi:hypothetical protein
MHKHKWISIGRDETNYVGNDKFIFSYGYRYECEKCHEKRGVSASFAYLHPQDPSVALPKWSLRK